MNTEPAEGEATGTLTDGGPPEKRDHALVLRTAGSMLLLMAALNALLVLSGQASFPYLLSAVIDILLGVMLLRLDDRFDVLVQFRAFAGGLAIPVLAFYTQSLPSAIFATIAQWGYSGPLLLCVSGKPARWRVVVAIPVFVTFALIPTLLVTAFLLVGGGER